MKYYNLWSMLDEYGKNKEKIDAYLKGDTIEGLDANTSSSNVMGLGIAVFLVILLISIALFIWAIVILVKHWNELSDVAKIFSIIGLVVGFPLLTIIIVYSCKHPQPPAHVFEFW